ncbi:MAG: efflux RND transporter periplasmic adaptor subunit [Rickettsiales bacterium]|nr:efflux RND transporter periplasmic adaptor subunit [Rickettsiales bacterium]
MKGKRLRKFSNLILPIFAAGMLIFTFMSIINNKKTPERTPEIMPPTTSFQNQVAGIGIVQPLTNIINVAPQIPGILVEFYVTENQELVLGTPLFTIDEAQTKAKIKHAAALLNTKKIQYADLKQHLDRFENIKDKRSISQDDLSRKRFAVQKAKAEIDEATQGLELLNVELNKLTVKSPIDGRVLKINSRIGEYVSNNTIPLVIGNLDKVLLKVIIDETDLHRVDTGAKAIAIMRGQPEKEWKLKFLSIEPLAIPKVQLSNNRNEKIDTRVIELLYEFESADINAVPGQQADVFIEATKEN